MVGILRLENIRNFVRPILYIRLDFINRGLLDNLIIKSFSFTL